MRKGKIYSTLTVFLSFCFLILGSLQAQATILTLELDYLFCGAREPAGTAPWLVATFDDKDTPGSVELNLSSEGLVGNEYVDRWHFNLDPLLDPALLSIEADEGNAISATEIIRRGNNEKAPNLRAASSGYYDIVFDFTNENSSNGPSKFNEDLSLNYTISGIVSLSALSFDFLSIPAVGQDKGPFVSAAHVLWIDTHNAESAGWIADKNGGTVVPEPATMLLLGSGLIGLGAFRGRLGKK
jgi:hypothetical protein